MMLEEESFDSVEKHLNVKSYYNYFVGDKRQGWSLNNEINWITSNGFNVSQALYKYRIESYRAAKMMLDISDERILSLSFIFLINTTNNNEGFISSLKEEDSIRSSLPTFVRLLPINEQGMMIMALKIDECNENQQQIKRCLGQLHTEHWNPEEAASVYFEIINAFCQQVKRISDTHTEQDYDLYEVFTIAIFNHDKYTHHKISKHLCASKEYIPDYVQTWIYV